MKEQTSAGITKQWIWIGNTLAEERDGSGATVKRFYAQGEQIGNANYYYTRDHLGSVREMTDNSGNVVAQYRYDSYGRKTKTSGLLESDFGYTGHYYHANSGLNLTLYRAYDPDTGRWQSRDPIEEEGGVNLYGYVLNNPVNAIDPLGLMSPKCMAALNNLQKQLAELAKLYQNYNPTKDAQGGWSSRKPQVKMPTKPYGHADQIMNQTRAVERALRRVEQDCKDDYPPKCPSKENSPTPTPSNDTPFVPAFQPWEMPSMNGLGGGMLSPGAAAGLGLGIGAGLLLGGGGAAALAY